MRISYWSSDVCSSDLDLVVEAVLTEQQLVDALEEHPGLRTLDDAVVVGRRDRDDLRQAEVGQRLGVGGLHLGRPVEGPDAHDAALARQEAGPRRDGADGARVSETERVARAVVREIVGV